MTTKGFPTTAPKILTRAEIKKRLDVAVLRHKHEDIYYKPSDYIEALETAKQLVKWLEGALEIVSMGPYGSGLVEDAHAFLGES